MKITSVTLRNFQCFGPDDTTIHLDDLTCFIGTNGAGKTAVLRALLSIFGAPARRRLHQTDFHVPAGEKLEDEIERRLVVEVRIDFPELDDGQDSGAIADCFAHMVVDAPGDRPYCRIRLEGTWSKSPLGGGDIDERLSWVTKESASDEGLQPLKTLDRARIQVFYVPASRDMAKQLANVSGTLLHQLLDAVLWDDRLRGKVEEAADNLRKQFDGAPAVDLVNSVSKRKWNDLYTDPIYSTPVLNFAATDFDSVLRDAQIVFGPTHENADHGCDRLSDGQQSLFYFAFINTLFSIGRDVQSAQGMSGGTDEDEGPDRISDYISAEKLHPALLTMFAVEEPENHLAPHYLGRIMRQLVEIGGDRYAQVVVTSHSSSIVSRVEPEHIRYFRMDHDSCKVAVRPVTLPDSPSEALKYVREAVRAFPELYFARLVVLCEGDSEEIVLPRIASASGDDLDSAFISVVPLGGRHINHLWRLLNDLEIPYVTLLDLDRERKTGGWAVIEYVIKELLRLNLSEEKTAKLLEVEGAGKPRVLSDSELDDMHTWEIEDMRNLERWCGCLRDYNVFFSTPLDLDFSMLSAFPDAYKSTADSRPKGCNKDGIFADEKIERAIRAILGGEGGDGATYTDADKALFPWYTYLFYGKGKPTTHTLAWLELSHLEVQGHLPESLRALMDRIREMLTDTEEP